MHILKVLAAAGVIGVGLTTAWNCPLGTLEAGQLPPFLKSNPLPAGFPWGNRNNDPKSDPPRTGITRHYHFKIARGKASPDGYEKDVILINGQFPGPIIEANWGDWIEVKVENRISNPEEGTALHWHGLLQKETPWYDGVPSVGQCPIAPNDTFTYRFRADTYGTSWYHSHYSAQYAGGLFGPMIIYGPTHVPYDIDLGPIFVTDWFHTEYFKVMEAIVSDNSTRWAQFSDNTLINGKNNFNCSSVSDGVPCKSNAGLSKFRFQKGKTYKLRLINAGAAGLQKFSIDGHILTVIANDYVPIKPYNATIVTLGIGQRSDVLVTATGNKNESYYMRTVQAPVPCARAKQPNGLAVVLYDNASENSTPKSTPYVVNQAPFSYPDCANDNLTLTVPYYPKKLPNPSTTISIVINQIVNSTGHQVYTIDGQTFHANFNDPLLLLANKKAPLSSYPAQSVVYSLGSNSSVRVVVHNNNTSPHPMHLHGHDMYILSAGNGPWDGKTIINPANPQRRDVQNMAPEGHLVMQFDTDNPGVWPFHCHIAWHLSQGLYLNFLERPNDVTQMEIPMIMQQTCKDWQAYSSKNVVMQISAD